jgi:prepilin-type N-terminal cleavage/methylation domain-containing protein
MYKRNRGFTLIELIIVIVIIGILAMVAIPKYFANIKKARKAQVVSTLRGIREAMMMYYSTNNAFPSVPTTGGNIAVTVDGDVVITANVPTGYGFATPNITSDATTIGDACKIQMNIDTGLVSTVSGTCP